MKPLFPLMANHTSRRFIKITKRIRRRESGNWRLVFELGNHSPLLIKNHPKLCSQSGPGDFSDLQ